MTYRSIRSSLHLAVLALFVALTASCYLPNKFELTMQVAPDGRYAVAYDGTLTQLLFLQRIGSGELQGHAIDEYVGIYENEMRRNSGFKEVTYLGNAEYQVKYEKQGSLAKEKQYSFPTRRGSCWACGAGPPKARRTISPGSRRPATRPCNRWPRPDSQANPISWSCSATGCRPRCART